MAELEIGARAPEFSLPASGGQTVSLADLRGRIVVLYLYPRDDTPGCTKEAIGFTGRKAEFAAAGAVVLVGFLNVGTGAVVLAVCVAGLFLYEQAYIRAAQLPPLS